MIYKSQFIMLLISVLLFTCKTDIVQEPQENLGLIEISRAQFKSEDMVLGKPEVSLFSETVHFTGKFVSSSNGSAQISLPIPGIIRKTNCTRGQYVSIGDVLFEISGNELIDLQKDFVESSAILERLYSDFLRTKELFDDNIGSKKEFILAETSYKVERANYSALKTKLLNIGLDPDEIEKDSFYSSYMVKSPISGHISDIQTTIGQYVSQQTVIATIIDNNSFLLKLLIFEKDINKLNEGQMVEFSLSNNKGKKEFAKVSFIGKTLDPKTKSIDCYAQIDNQTKNNFIENQFIEGDIIVASDSVIAVPETALLRSENKHFLLFLEKETDQGYYFRKMEVNIGRSVNNSVELIDVLESGTVVINGNYNIQIE